MSVAGPRSRRDEVENNREFWLDSFASRIGFGRVAQWLPGSIPPSYVYAVVAVVVPNILTAAYNLSTGVPLVYSENPYYLLQPLLLVGAVWAARMLHHDYDHVIVEMGLSSRASNSEQFTDPTPSWVPWSLFAVAVAILFIFPGNMSEWTLTTYIANFFILPFVYTPIVVQFFTVYVTIEFIAPWRLARSDVGIHFFDPEGVGGLRPLGELVKKAYYFVVIGLIGYAFITYAPFIESGWTVSRGANLLFTSIWLVTIGTVAFAVFQLHRFMHHEKRATIHRLEQQICEHVTHPWDVEAREVPPDKEQTVADLEERIKQVSQTSEYPATFSIWSQLLISIALPKIVQYTISGF